MLLFESSWNFEDERIMRPVKRISCSSQDVFPSSERRGGCATKRMLPKATDYGADGVVSHDELFANALMKHFPARTTPSAPASVAPRLFLDGAATPPVSGGEYVFHARAQPAAT
jgi:hypothetical protein